MVLMDQYTRLEEDNLALSFNMFHQDKQFKLLKDMLPYLGIHPSLLHMINLDIELNCHIEPSKDKSQIP